nr:helix-turn-helix transcriptional regulator [Saccharothrix ecbatanensis]
MLYRVRLRTGVFTFLRRTKFRSEYALAKAMGVNRSTVSRVLAGELQPGSAFIAGALAAFTPVTFEDLFEVVNTSEAIPATPPPDHRPS